MATNKSSSAIDILKSTKQPIPEPFDKRLFAFYKAAPTASSANNKRNNSTLCVLVGGIGFKHQTFAKYVELYHKRGIDTLCLLPPLLYM